MPGKQSNEFLLGPELSALMDQPGFDELASVTWKQGLIRAARVAVPDWNFEGPDAHAVLRAIVRSPAAICLRELTVGLLSFEGGGLENVAQDIISGGELACLERLFIGDFQADEQEISWVSLGDLSPLYPLTPRLQSLMLHGAGIVLGELSHPTLERLVIETGGLPRESVASLAAAKLPRLSDLEAWFGRREYGGTADIAALRPMFTSKTLPLLHDLGLQNSEMQDAIAIELIGSPLLDRIMRLDLSMGTMHEPGAEAILAHAASFEHLESLNLRENYIPSQLADRLRASFGEMVELGGQRTPDYADGEPEYYAVVGE